MKYNFDNPPSRIGTYSYKWEECAKGELPMWVADMEFQTAPEIREAIEQRVAHGIFGYNVIPQEWTDAYCSWWERKHGLTMEPEGLMFCTGVVATISSTVRKLTTPNENVVIQTPVYNIFFNSIRNNGARILESPLVEKDGIYDMDLEDLEKKLSDPQTSLMILCNPQNPAGKIWPKETLRKVGELCAKYHVTVLSDEIHCDVAEPGKSYVPFASVSDTCRDISITCIAPTKAWNLAGLQTAAIYVPNPYLRHKVWRAINTDEVAEPNSLACVAAIAAFTKGEAWLTECNEYIWENRRILQEFVAKELPKVKVTPSDATYLAWLKVDAYGDSETVAAAIRKETGLVITAGAEYGASGDAFLRMNLAGPRAMLLDGLERLKKGLNSIKQY